MKNIQTRLPKPQTFQFFRIFSYVFHIFIIFPSVFTLRKLVRPSGPWLGRPAWTTSKTWVVCWKPWIAKWICRSSGGSWMPTPWWGSCKKWVELWVLCRFCWFFQTFFGLKPKHIWWERCKKLSPALPALAWSQDAIAGATGSGLFGAGQWQVGWFGGTVVASQIRCLKEVFQQFGRPENSYMLMRWPKAIPQPLITCSFHHLVGSWRVGLPLPHSAGTCHLHPSGCRAGGHSEECTGAAQRWDLAGALCGWLSWRRFFFFLNDINSRCFLCEL